MLTHLYGYHYDDAEPNPLSRFELPTPNCVPYQTTAAKAKMLNNVLVYALAEKYNITNLMVIATGKFEAIHDDLNPTPSVLSGFLPVVIAVHETTPDSEVGLRRSAARFCAQYMKAIIADDAWWEFITGHREFVRAMFDAHF